MSPSLKQAHDVDSQLDKHASAVAHSIEHALNSIKSPAQVDVNCLANQVQQTFLTSHQIMPFANKDTIRQDLEDTHEKHMQGLGALRRLPGELRIPIFTDVLAAGSMEIMRVSKAVNREASPIHHANGICTLFVGFRGTRFARRCAWFDIIAPGFSVDRIQNVTFFINAARSPELRSMGSDDCLRLFAESRVHRKHCRVVFKTARFLDRMALWQVLHIVRQYTRFGKVDIKLAIDHEQLIMEELRTSSSPIWIAFEYRDKKMEALDLVEYMLSPNLGKSRRFEEDSNTVVTFCPRKHDALCVHEEDEPHASTGN